MTRVVLLRGARRHPLVRAAREALAEVGVRDVLELEQHTQMPACDLLVSAAYTSILEPEYLALARHRINVHPSRLPDYRGSHPVYWALFERQPTLGVTVHEMVADVDRGPIVEQEEVPLDPDEPLASAYERAAVLARILLKRALQEWLDTGGFASRPQQGEGSYRSRPDREADRLKISWHLPGTEVVRRVGIFPGDVWFEDATGRRRRVYRARLAGRTNATPGQQVRRRLVTRTIAAGDQQAVVIHLWPSLRGTLKRLPLWRG